jgi:hypothetical protein
MNLVKVHILILLSWSYSGQGALVGTNDPIYKPIIEYNKVHRKFFKKVCRGADRKYLKLLKKYRGQGHYLPEVSDDVDRNAIKQNIHHFDKKLAHIEKIIEELKKKKKLPSFSLVVREVEGSIEKLLKYKKTYFTKVDPQEKQKARDQSSLELKILQNKFSTMMNQLYFLKSYNFPNDHLKNRKSYDDVKGLKGIRARKKANKTFFYRRIIEDGAYDKNHTRPDIYLRSTLDTIYLNVMKPHEFIHENIRYDITWAFKRIESMLKRGYKVQLSRMIEWRDRTKRAKEFYADIIQSKNEKKARAIIQKKNQASKELKKYVISKQKDVYTFWMKEKEINRALYVMSTILYNEVGTIDGEEALERKDVAQIVINRHGLNFYRQLARGQDLREQLGLTHRKHLQYPWLNVLFREGEFSFTYFYISSVSNIFCPDMSRRGKGIRSRNLKISMLALKHERNHFKPTRYFSRISMLGKVDMGKVWEDFAEYPERPGYEIERQKALRQSYIADNYKYLYSFSDPSGVVYQVVLLDGEFYSVTWRKGKPVFYSYRDPHLFRYFSKI